MTFQKIVDLYERGAFTGYEAVNRLLAQLTEDSYDEFKAQVSDELLGLIQAAVVRFPTTLEDWGKMRTFQIRMCLGYSLEEQTEANRRHLAQLRRGVEIFRSHSRVAS